MTASRQESAPADPFGARLRRLREAAGLSQEELAEHAGLTPNAVGTLERGTRGHPYPATVRALAAALGLDEAERAALIAAVPRRGRAAPEPPAPRSAPPTPPALIGRERELAAIGGLLRGDGARLLTLTGPGGIGKTALARRAAADLAPRFADGAVFVDLTPVRDPALVLPAIARALGLRDGDAERLIGHLRERALLLVLDNLEQVVEAAPDLAEVVAACPRMAVLATSRVRLNVAAERVYPVPPLATAPTAAAAAEASPAAALFAERARAVDPHFALVAHRASVEAICQRLDGLPLAIELAAARVAVLPPAALLPRLARRLPLLTGGPRDAPARQRTLRDTIAWSYDLLEPAEQALFRRLGVFVGGFTLEAAETVCGPLAPSVFDGVASLADQSLLRQQADPDGEPRFEMLETVREFALEQLAANGEAETVRERHADVFVAVAEAATPSFFGADERAGLARLATEMPNLRAAAAWALGGGHTEIALRLGTASFVFMYVRTDPSEALAWLDAALAMPGETDPAIRADALHAASQLASIRGDLARSAALAAELVALARALDDPVRTAKALLASGNPAEWAGDFDRAASLFEEGLVVLGTRDDDPEIAGVRAMLTCNVATMHLWRGNPEEALPLAERALEWWQQVGNAWGTAWGLETLAGIASATGDQAGAARLCGEALELRVAMAFQADVAGAIDGVAGVAAALGQPERAVRLIAAARSLRDGVGVRFGTNSVLGEQVLADMRARLEAPDFAAAWDAGRARSPEQAIADARAVIAEVLATADTPARP